MFNIEKLNIRHSSIFLRNFVEEVIKPIKKDDKFHLDYVPTQVFAELIHFLVPSGQSTRLDGILYPSAKSETGNNIALFITNEQCIDKNAPTRLRITFDPPNPVLSLIEAKSIEMNPGVLKKALNSLRKK